MFVQKLLDSDETSSSKNELIFDQDMRENSNYFELLAVKSK